MDVTANRTRQPFKAVVLEGLRHRFSTSQHILGFLCAITVLGVFFGAIVAGQLKAGDASALSSAVRQLLDALLQHQLASSGQLWWQRMASDAQLLALIWLFGVSVIGMPFIVVAIFLRSFSIGFSIGFTVIQFGWKGFLVASIAIFLHQIVTMAVFIVAGLFAIRFSANLLKQVYPLPKLSIHFIKYTSLFVLCVVGLMVGAAIQAYIAPKLLLAVLTGS